MDDFKGLITLVLLIAGFAGVFYSTTTVDSDRRITALRAISFVSSFSAFGVGLVFLGDILIHVPKA